jgi:hypothetical protein
VEVDSSEAELRVSAASIAKGLGLFAAALVVLSLIGQVLRLNLGYEYAFGFVPKFNLDEENNVPSFFQACQLAMVAGLLGLVFVLKKGDRFRTAWGVLCGLFVFLAFDEASVIHETLIDPLRAMTHASGIFHYAWVVAAIPLVAVFLIGYARFFWHLAPVFKKLVGLAFGVYLSGALVMELIGGAYAEKFGLNNWGYVGMTTVEESLEMAGQILMIYALCRYVATYWPRLRVSASE